jgi:predicted dehydrogenase
MHSSDSTSTYSRTLKVAFLGGAFDSAVGRAHRAAIEMDQRFELVAGCFSRKAEISKATALKYGIDPNRAYHRIDQLLTSEAGKVDAIVVMTPQDQHGQQVVTCLEAGVPVICEKALVESAKEAVAIKNKLLSCGGFLAVIYNYTGYPILRELKHMIQQGRIGRIQQIQIEMPQEGFARVSPDGLPITPQQWRLHDAEIPTISLDLGVHLHMMVGFLTGERPEELVATSKSYGNFKQITDNISCLANYSNDLICNIWYSKTALGYRNGLKLRVFGEKGTAEWVQEHPEYLHMSDNSGGRFIVDRASKEITIANQSRYTRFKAGHPAGFIEAFANYYYDVADALEHFLGKKDNSTQDYVFGIDESIEGLRMLEAISRSSVNKRWEKVV